MSLVSDWETCRTFVGATINFHRKLHWQVFIMKRFGMDFSAQITRTAEFSSEQRWHSRGKKKCIHLCNLPSATIYFFVSQDMHCVRKKSLFFFPLLITSFSDLSFFCLLMMLQTEIVLQLIFYYARPRNRTNSSVGRCSFLLFQTKLLGMSFHLVKQER